MDGTNLDSQQPSSLAARLPPTLNLEAVARETGALRRRRAIKSGAQLLELALAYSGGALSLRSTALWAGTSGVGQICDVSVLDRLRNASEFLRSVLTAVLAPRLEVRGAARRVRVIDATTISSPGKGGEWRLHVDYDLARHQMISCELTEGRQSESLRRFRFAPGDIALGDRGYAKARDMQKVREAGADFVVRIGWNALRLRNADGSKFDLIGALPAIAPGEHVEVRAWIQVSRSKRSLMPVRLVLARHPKGPTVERNRSRATRKSAADGKKVRPETLLSAEYTLLATSLDQGSFTAAEVVTLYEMRWQIELYFKRRKSIMGIDELPAKDPRLVRSWIYAKLIAAALTETFVAKVLDSPPSAERI